VTFSPTWPVWRAAGVKAEVIWGSLREHVLSNL
jgi:hypothetical protein